MNSADRSPYRWIAVSLVFVSGFVTIGWIWLSLPILLPDISREFSLKAWQTQVIFGSISFSFILSAYLGGQIGDRYPLKWIIGTGVLVMGLGAYARYGFPGYTGAIVASLITGVGIGLSVPNYISVLRNWFPPRELGIANGIRLAGVRGGAAVGQGFLLGFLVYKLGDWQSSQLVLGTAALATACLWFLLYEDPKKDTDGESFSKPNPVGFWSLLNHGELLLLGSMTFLHLFSFIAYIGLLPTWLSRMGTISKNQVGFYSSIIFLSSLVGGLLLPWLSDRIHRRKAIMYPALSMMILGMIGTGLARNPGYLSVLIGVTGLGGGAMLPMLLTLVSEHSSEMLAGGSAVGIQLSMGQIGSTIGPPVGGALLDWTGIAVSAGCLGGLLLAAMILLIPVQETGDGSSASAQSGEPSGV